jgi:hypothetical protein
MIVQRRINQMAERLFRCPAARTQFGACRLFVDGFEFAACGGNAGAEGGG